VLYLRAFGSLDLRGTSGRTADSLLAQPRGMALLVYLLLSRPGDYLRRDTLCALFWPDADDDHARGALSQTLTRIRRSAGQHVVELRGKGELRVAPGTVSCDVLSFQEAVSSGDLAAALDLYAGPFLAGFHVTGAPGFEDWAEVERDRLRSVAAGAAAELASRHMAGGRLAEAGRVAAAALELAPESEAAAGELMRGLWAAGDRTGALHLYERWAATLTRELELEPSPELAELAAEIRATPRRPAAAPPPPITEPAVPRCDSSVSTVPEASGASASEVPALREGAAGPDDIQAVLLPAPSRWRPRRHAVTGSAAGILLLLAGWALAHVSAISAYFPMEATGRATASFAPTDWLVVADFEARSVDPGLALAFETLLVRDLESAGYASVAGGLGALSHRGLDDVLARMRLPPGTRVDADLACEIAEREGAAGVLAGRILPLGNEFVLDASLLDVTDCQELIRVSTVVAFEQLSDGVSAVSRELRARLGESRASIRNSPPLPPATAEYITALRAISDYLAAPDLWDDEVHGAAKLLEAIRIEPDFAFAHVLLAFHYQRVGWYARAVPHFARAYELREQLPRQGRLGMEAIHQRYIESDPRASMATVETIVARHPVVADASLPFLSELALWTGEWQRALDVSVDYLRRGPAGFSAHVAYSSGETAAWALGRVELADSMHRGLVRAMAAAGSEPDREMLLLHHLRHRDWAAAEALCAAHPAWDRCGYVHLARGRLTAAADRLGAAAVRGDAGRGSPWERAAAAAALAHIERLGGRQDRARSLVERASRNAATADGASAVVHLTRFLLCSVAAELEPVPDLPLCVIEAEDPADWDSAPSFTVILRSGAWSRRLLAVQALRQGRDPDRALELARAAVQSNFGNPGTVDHLIHALAFDALERPDSARARYVAAARIERDGMFPTAAGILFPLAPVYRRIGELADADGDTATALEYYAAFADLWADADPGLLPQVMAVRQRIIRLRPHR
jgi:DNA-binding SARP family transcriptional activator